MKDDKHEKEGKEGEEGNMEDAGEEKGREEMNMKEREGLKKEQVERGKR